MGAPICMLYTGTETARHFPANERREGPVFESPSERKRIALMLFPSSKDSSSAKARSVAFVPSLDENGFMVTVEFCSSLFFHSESMALRAHFIRDFMEPFESFVSRVFILSDTSSRQRISGGFCFSCLFTFSGLKRVIRIKVTIEKRKISRTRTLFFFPERFQVRQERNMVKDSTNRTSKRSIQSQVRRQLKNSSID